MPLESWRVTCALLLYSFDFALLKKSKQIKLINILNGCKAPVFAWLRHVLALFSNNNNIHTYVHPTRQLITHTFSADFFPSMLAVSLLVFFMLLLRFTVCCLVGTQLMLLSLQSLGQVKVWACNFKRFADIECDARFHVTRSPDFKVNNLRKNRVTKVWKNCIKINFVKFYELVIS